MNPDPTSLDNLQDIAAPPPVSWWPPAPGWWVLLTIMAVAFAAVAFRAWRAWRRNAYRRAALLELENATTTAEVSEVLKRTALAAWPRTEVAWLSGETWSRWLGDTLGRPVPPVVSSALAQAVYTDVDKGQFAVVAAFAKEWISGHEVVSKRSA